MPDQPFDTFFDLTQPQQPPLEIVKIHRFFEWKKDKNENKSNKKLQKQQLNEYFPLIKGSNKKASKNLEKTWKKIRK